MFKQVLVGIGDYHLIVRKKVLINLSYFWLVFNGGYLVSIAPQFSISTYASIKV